MLKENIEEVLNKKNNHVNSFELYLDDKLIDYFEDMTTSQIKACIANIGYHNFNNAIFYLCRGTNVFYAVSVDINNIEYTEN